MAGKNQHVPGVFPTGKLAAGLDILSNVSSISITKNIQFLEILTGIEAENSYGIFNNRGELFLWAREKSHLCSRIYVPAYRPLRIILSDSVEYKEILHFNRPLRCVQCCFPKCHQVMEVYTNNKVFLGHVEEKCNWFIPKMIVKNGNGEIVFYIRGECCYCYQAAFVVLSKDKTTVVARIRKNWSGIAREMFTDSYFFGIEYSQDMDVKMKALLLGALFLIDYIFYETAWGSWWD